MDNQRKYYRVTIILDCDPEAEIDMDVNYSFEGNDEQISGSWIETLDLLPECPPYDCYVDEDNPRATYDALPHPNPQPEPLHQRKIDTWRY